MSDFLIRRAVETDTPQLLAMSSSLAKLDGYRGSIALPDGAVFHVATAPSAIAPHGVIVGMVCTRLGAADTLLVSHLYVVPTWRRCGVATALVDALGSGGVEIVVYRKNRAAMAFWQRQGFKLDERLILTRS